MSVVGHDPGKEGGLAALYDDGRFMRGLRVPVFKIGKGRKEINIAAIRQWLVMVGLEEPIKLVAIERASAGGAITGGGQGEKRRMGTASACSFCASEALVRGCAIGLGLPVARISSNTWSPIELRGFPRKGRSQRKASAAAAALDLYPDLAGLLHYQADWGIADATLIARFAMRSHNANIVIENPKENDE
jgi:hypothetical protein